MRGFALGALASLCLVTMAHPSLGDEIKASASSGARAHDIPGDATTKAVLEVGKTVYSSLETVGDHDWFRMELKAGVEYQVRLHGVGVKELNDPFLELRDASGNLLGAVDDRSPGESWGGPNATDPVGYINITTSGTFYIDVSSFVGGDTADDVGDYIVTLVENPPDGSFFQTHDEIAWQLTTNYMEFLGYDQAIAFDLGPDGKLTYNISKLTRAGAGLAEAALRAWTDVSGIRFARTSGAAELDFDDSDAGTNAYSSPTVGGDGAQIVSSKIMITTGWLDSYGTKIGSYSSETYIHQIGQALGLGKAGNYMGTVSGQYFKNDSLAYSIMSYSQAANDDFTQSQPADNPNVDASFRHMLTPAVADIIAIKNLYPRRTETRIGDTTYGFNSNTGDLALDMAASLGADMFMCVYDDGGTDTLDFNRTKATQRIDLNAESFSNVLGGKMNLSIARGVVIENAIGGSGRDTLIGNAGANSLTGGDGRDTFVFSSPLGAVDRIEDFAPGDDTIELSSSVFKKLAVGALPRAAFKDLGAGGVTVDRSDRIIYDRGTGALSYDPDGDGGRPAVRFATIRNKARLTAANFVVR
jgi:serralysin